MAKGRYSLYYDRRADKDLSAIDSSDAKQVRDRAKKLRDEPRPPRVVKLGPQIYRVRQGDYRIIYIVDDSERVIVVSRVKRRNEATYKDPG